MDYGLPDEFKNMLKGLQDLYEEAYVGLRKEVTNIIKNNIRDSVVLEHTFDKLLNIPTDKCYKLFLLLYEFVFTFDSQLATDYLEIYNEFYGDNDMSHHI